MKTEKIYQTDVYQRKGEATLLEVITEEKQIQSLGGSGACPCFVLDRTVFFPEGGGQPCDQGVIGGFDIESVWETDGIVYHQIRNSEKELPEEGTVLEMEINWERRFLNMQRHCGEHILSAAFYELCGGVNRGFHMGESHMTIDISLEEDPSCIEMTDSLIKAVELRANQYVWEDQPVTTVVCATREEAERYPMRKQLKLEKDITLVCVGDPEKPAGRVACCGTHPSSAGQVGVIKIYGYEKNKGMYRIYCDAGRNAFLQYRKLNAVSDALCRKYSADLSTLEEKIQTQEQKTQEMRKEFFELRKCYLAKTAEEITEACKQQEKTVYIQRFAELRTDDVLNLAKMIPQEITTTIALVVTGENTVILVSHGQMDCNKIIKENAGVWNGKGGGRPACARAMFARKEDCECFLEFLAKMR